MEFAIFKLGFGHLGKVLIISMIIKSVSICFLDLNTVICATIALLRCSRHSDLLSYYLVTGWSNSFR